MQNGLQARFGSVYIVSKEINVIAKTEKLQVT